MPSVDGRKLFTWRVKNSHIVGEGLRSQLRKGAEMPTNRVFSAGDMITDGGEPEVRRNQGKAVESCGQPAQEQPLNAPPINSGRAPEAVQAEREPQP